MSRAAFALANLARRLRALADPEDDGCSVDAKAKRAAAPFLNSWCIPIVEALLTRETGEGDRSLATFILKHAASDEHRARERGGAS